jgi:RNA polymerase sigma-70 factor, ECF subfamily
VTQSHFVSVPAIPDDVARELHRDSGAAAWNVSLTMFTERLTASAASRFKSAGTVRDVESYVRGLHLNDLALACACASGHDAAWEHFVREMRPALYAAARAIARPDTARDLADSLYAQLFGVDAKGQQRRSLLDYYHGRARLSTWLRTVLAQRHIDAVRERARTVPLDTEAEQTMSATSSSAEPDLRDNVARVQRALNDAVDALDARDRLRLRLYYAQRLTLARIGRALGEHEATASRNLERVRRTLRQEIERRLRESHGMDAAGVASCLQQAVDAPDLDLSHVLAADDT